MARPKKLKEDDYRTVERLATLGISIKKIAWFLEINESTAMRDTEFCKYYKKGLAEVGAKVRSNLLHRLEWDESASVAIYLDKVINKTTEQSHDDNIELKRADHKEKVKMNKLQAEKIKKEISGEGDKDELKIKIEGI